MSFTIGILSFYPHQIQPRMSNYWIWTLFFPHCSACPLCFASRESVQTGRKDGSVQTRTPWKNKPRLLLGREGIGMPCDPEQHISLHPVNSNSTNSYASIHLPGQGQPGQQQHIQRRPCNWEASASLPRVPFPWQAILCSLGIQFRNNSPNLSPLLSCPFFNFSPRN